MKQETGIVGAVEDAVNASGLGFVWRNQSGGVRVKRGYLRLAPAGSPDLVGWTRGGRFLGIEVKVEGNRTEKVRAAKQAEWRTRIREAGGVAFEVVGAHEVISLLSEAVGTEAA